MENSINLIISGIALLASIYAVISAKADVKKQLRLSKLEEILEITTFMLGYYRSLFMIFHGMKDNLESLKKSNEVTERMKENINRQKGFTAIVTSDMIIDRTTRLVTLSNAYLPNSRNLKLKINTLTTVYFNMYLFISYKNPFPEIEELSVIPKPEEMEKFIQKIEAQIINEMKLGYKAISKKQHREYFQKHFKNDIENS